MPTRFVAAESTNSWFCARAGGQEALAAPEADSRAEAALLPLTMRSAVARRAHRPASDVVPPDFAIFLSQSHGNRLMSAPCHSLYASEAHR